jgi:hypothetical protein
MILISEEEKQKERNDRMKLKKLKIKELIKESLAKLNNGLSHYEQTTHGRLIKSSNPKDMIQDFAQQLLEVYTEPSSYNISELSQCIDNMLKKL